MANVNAISRGSPGSSGNQRKWPSRRLLRTNNAHVVFFSQHFCFINQTYYIFKNKANRYVKVLFLWITSFAVNQNDIKCTFQGPQDKPVTSPRLPQDWNFPGGGSPDSSNGRGTTPSLLVYLLRGLLLQSLVYHLFFLSFITADILRMRFNDLLTKAFLWDRYVVYLIIWFALSFVMLMHFICFPKFHLCFAGISWEFVTNFSCAFVVTALPMRKRLTLEASTVLLVWNIYPALSMEKVNVCLAFLQPTYAYKLVFKSGKRISKVASYSCF